MEQNNQNIQRLNEDEIDLADLLRQVWAGRWIILITTGVFLVMGVLYLLYNKYTGIKEYESQATLFVESPSPDSLIPVIKSPLFISEVLKIKLIGLKPGAELTVAEVLDQKTEPPQGNLAGLTDRINATKGNAGILVMAVKMQDQRTAKQLTDSVVQKLTQFLKETQVKRAAKNQELLLEDTTKSFQVMREATSRNLQYLSKGASKNIQYLTQGSSKNIQFLTEGYTKAESIYLQAQKALADYYTLNSKSSGMIDSLEVKRLNADIKLKYNVYSGLYQQLESAKIEAKKQAELVNIDATKQLEQAKLEAEKQFEQKRIDAAKQLEQVNLDAVKKVPVINLLEPATLATELNVPKTKKVLLLMGFFGIIVGVGIVFGKKFWEKNFKEKS
jgi:hypothetical protein